MLFTDIVISLDKPNKNNRVYSKTLFEKALKDITPKIEERSFLGTLFGLGDDFNIGVNNISHVVTELKIDDDGNLVGTIEVLDTPVGERVKRLIESGEASLSPRGFGSVINIQRELHLIDENDYKLISIDVIEKKEKA
jgi:hypothetical protein